MSAKRFYTARQMPTTEAGILTLGLSQLYVSLGDATADGGIVVRIWWKPLVTLIWLGGLVMMVAGAISLTDRRLRVGAPAQAGEAIGRQACSERVVTGKRFTMLLAAALCAIAAAGIAGPAVQPGEMLADPALEARARALSAELRCMVCQNQSIDDSDAELAHDLRVVGARTAGGGRYGRSRFSTSSSRAMASSCF